MVKRISSTLALCAFSLVSALAQTATPTPAPTVVPPPVAPAPVMPPPMTPATESATPTPAPTDGQPAPIAPPTTGAAPAQGLPGAAPLTTNTNPEGRSVNEFQGDDIGQVLRLLARQANINLVVSDKVTGSVTMRLSNVTPLKAIQVVCTSKNLTLDEIDGVYYVKTLAEKAAEPTQSQFYTFSYAQAKDIVPLLAQQLQSKVAPQFDQRTNTVFYQETKSNIDRIKHFLATVDTPTKQVMIEARLVEVTASPQQSYGINWGGTFGNSTQAKTFTFGGTTVSSGSSSNSTQPAQIVNGQILTTGSSGQLMPTDFLNQIKGITGLAGGQLAILSAPSFSATLRLLNEDSDADFLANPRVVTANNEEATIEITRNQPVPELSFNAQTATPVFNGFKDKIYGNTLEVTPTINKDDFVSLKVRPTISNKVGNQVFSFQGANVEAPIIDTRTLNSNVVIKSGDTLAIGGLLQDEDTKGANKVPILGDIPVIGYAFQEHLNARVKRNLLVFVTPTIIKQGYGTGLEDQVNGLKYTGDDYADPNGWRNNAKGALRLRPTSHRSIAADYPMPGTPIAPKKVKHRTSHADND